LLIYLPTLLFSYEVVIVRDVAVYCVVVWVLRSVKVFCFWKAEIGGGGFVVVAGFQEEGKIAASACRTTRSSRLSFGVGGRAGFNPNLAAWSAKQLRPFNCH